MADALARLLEDVRPRGALFDRSAMPSPWSLRFDDDTPLAVAVMLRGHAWISAEGVPPVPIGPGDIAVLVRAGSYTVSDEPGTAPQAVVRGIQCTTTDGRPIDDVPELCSDRWDPDDSVSVLLKASFETRNSAGERVLQGLPPILTVAAATLPYTTVGAVADELARDRPGQQAVLERLLDLLVVTALREWLDRPDSPAPAWYRAHSDPVVGPALELLHARPAEPWTVTTLARHVAVARSTLARQFAALVGEPPMRYLARWRLCLATDLLRDTDDTVDAIARTVGYSSSYALSNAFNRVCGTRPTHVRARLDDPA